jgi:hypothetical protein
MPNATDAAAIRPAEDWTQWVDRPHTAAVEAALHRCVNEGRPFGDEQWLERVQKPPG